MSEQKKPPRSLSEINQEYTALCAQAGQKYYQLQCAEDDLKALNNAIRAINNEAAQSKQFYEALDAAKKPESASNVTPISEGEKANA